MRRLTLGLAVMALAACSNPDRAGEDAAAPGSDGGAVATVSVPAELIGTWAEDCDRPGVRLTATQIEVYADGQTYDLTEAALEGDRFTVAYASPNGSYRETYSFDGETLDLASGTYEGTEVVWDKPAMRRCE